MLKPVNKEKNPGLAKLPEKVRNKMGYAKKGKMLKASVGVAVLASKKGQDTAKKVMKAKAKLSPSLNYLGRDMGGEAKSTRGYGAARTSGMGLQDEQLVPGKSLDYYKDLM